MGSFIICIGFFYILLGFIFLFVPLIYLEIGRSRDLFISAISLLIGVFLIIKNKVYGNLSVSVFILMTVLLVMFVSQIFIFRWNQLTDKEKDKLITFVEFKKNISKTLEAIKLGLKNFRNPINLAQTLRKKEKVNKKKWVRNDKNDSIKS